MLLDMEMASENSLLRKIFPDPKVAAHHLISTVAFDSYTKNYHIFVYRDDFVKKQYVVHRKLTDGKTYKCYIYESGYEVDILKGVAKLWKVLDPDLLLGWNSDQFDFPYYFKRCERLGVLRWVSKLISPTGYIHIGHNSVSVPGYEFFDLMKGAKKILGKYVDGSLEAVSQHILGIGKLGDTVSAVASWQYDIDLLVDYNIRDVELTVRLDNEMPIYNYFQEQMDTTGSNIRDTLMANFKVCQNYIMYNKDKHPLLDNFMLPVADYEKEDFEGAITLPSKIGIHPMIAVHDLTMMYPMIMRACNMSPETIVKKSNFTEEEWIAMEPLHVNGVYFRQDFKGFIPILIDIQIQMRRDVEADMKAYSEDFGEGFEFTTQYETYLNKRMNVKNLINSWYGVFGYKKFVLYINDIAKSVTFIGRAQLIWSKDFVKENYDIDTIYGDSVRANTPIMTLSNNKIQITEIQHLPFPAKVWTEKGWTEIKRVIQHRVKKEMFRVLTHTGFIEVTEDHSLLDPNGKEVSPKNLEVRQELLHSFPHPQHSLNCDCQVNPITEYYNEYDNGLNEDILNACIHEKIRFIENIRTSKVVNIFYAQGSLQAQGIYKILHDLGSTVTISKTKYDGFNLMVVTGMGKMSNEIKKIESLGVCDEIVYDLETENHHFAAGVGQMIVHNTDSIFIYTPKELVDAYYEAEKNFEQIQYERIQWLGNFKIEDIEIEEDHPYYSILEEKGKEIADAWFGVSLFPKRLEYIQMELKYNQTFQEIIDFHEEVGTAITASYDDFSAQYGIKKHDFGMKFEKLYQRLFFAKLKAGDRGAKKRYVGRIIYKDGKKVDKTDIAGFQSKRSDTAKVTMNCQKEIFDKIVSLDDPVDDIRKIVRKYYLKTIRGKFDHTDVAKPRGIGRELRAYKIKNRTYHWYAVIWSNENLGTAYSKGSKPKFIPLKYIPAPYNQVKWYEENKDKWMAFSDDHPLPEEMIEIVNWKLITEMTIISPMLTITDSLGIDMQEIITGQKQLDVRSGL